jgi:hypothetical protein
MEKGSFDRRTLLGAGLVLPVALAVPGSASAQAPPPTLGARLSPMTRFLGQWRGEGEGQPGHSAVERSYAAVLGGQFLFASNVSSYPPQERNRAGERHEDHGYYSFDSARSRMVLRQFHVEGFFTQYLAASDALDGPELVFDSEAIENIPAGFRARETYRFDGPDAFEEVFETAEPGGGLEVYSRTRLRRVAP